MESGTHWCSGLTYGTMSMEQQPGLLQPSASARPSPVSAAVSPGPTCSLVCDALGVVAAHQGPAELKAGAHGSTAGAAPRSSLEIGHGAGPGAHTDGSMCPRGWVLWGPAHQWVLRTPPRVMSPRQCRQRGANGGASPVGAVEEMGSIAWS